MPKFEHYGIPAVSVVPITTECRSDDASVRLEPSSRPPLVLRKMPASHDRAQHGRTASTVVVRIQAIAASAGIKQTCLHSASTRFKLQPEQEATGFGSFAMAKGRYVVIAGAEATNATTGPIPRKHTEQRTGERPFSYSTNVTCTKSFWILSAPERMRKLWSYSDASGLVTPSNT
ncbi:hypothetical protein NKR23_g12377 [Pleurostoma richardsiae]|uniref:Uncharacterized protein n=1 Tax=Pleurostoma richardsiae TaxID=41990 RepID=A0AA38R272_9PEZI|nr:hypothetical protein NKR23_g12377 [Pleurostoma richardsiae]